MLEFATPHQVQRSGAFRRKIPTDVRELIWSFVMDKAYVRCRYLVRLIAQLEHQCRTMGYVPRQMEMGEAVASEALVIHIAVFNVLNQEINSLNRQLRRCKVKWDDEMDTFEFETNQLVRWGQIPNYLLANPICSESPTTSCIR